MVLIVFTVVAEWRLVVGGTAIGQDSATFFYPMYSFLGERLRAGHIPMWNPYQFSGIPFAADPQSGWMYWPAMVFFTLLPLVAAAKSYMFFHLLLAGVSTYALARALGMGPSGALLAGIAYEFIPFLSERNVCCFAYTGVIAWLPVLLLGAELAIRSRDRLLGLVWSGVAGFALSQIFASWLGQGSYYALLLLGSYVAYRTIIAPPDTVCGLKGRVGSLVFHGTVIVVLGLGLAAAGLLPRLEYNALSNLAGGYKGSHELAVLGGWPSQDWDQLLQWDSLRYAGGAILALALLAPLIARTRHATPYFLALSASALVLGSPQSTPLHWLLYHLLPGFRQLHPHYPDRIRMLLYLGLALLAGATWDCIQRRSQRWAAAALVPALATLLLLRLGAQLSGIAIVAGLLASALLAAGALFPRGRRVLSVLLVLVAFVDLYGSTQVVIDSRMRLAAFNALRTVNLSAYYDPTSAGDYLRSMDRQGQFRYFGFNTPGQIGEPFWADPLGKQLLLNNRAMLLHLQDVQGYDPVHIARYDDYMTALNGRQQDYWYAYVFRTGLQSRLLDLLNVRYLVVPAAPYLDQRTRESLEATYRTVYTDGRVQVMERPSALPRVWIVHEARQVSSGEALRLLKSGQVDPRKVALLEQPPPPLRSTSAPDVSRVTSYSPDSMTVSTQSPTPALLVLSEVYYPAWHAYVDGKRVPLYVVDHVLRGVPLPPGEHDVVLRFESASLQLGLGITGLTYLLLAALVLFVVRRSRGVKYPGAGWIRSIRARGR